MLCSEASTIKDESTNRRQLSTIRDAQQRQVHVRRCEAGSTGKLEDGKSERPRHYHECSAHMKSTIFP